MENKTLKNEGWEKIKDYVYPILLSEETAKIMPKELVSRQFLDMMVVYKVSRYVGTEGQKAYLLGHGSLCRWGIDEREVYEQAMGNLLREEPHYDYQPILNVVQMLMKAVGIIGNIFSEPLTEEQQLCILTNKERTLGASCILNKGYLRKISDGKNLYLFPSSIHEFLLLKDNENMEQRELDMVVWNVNREQLFPGERLADHTYYYDYGRDEIRVSKKTAGETAE